MNNKTKGFTLIELLVVIAIIGILAALVLVALGSARDKANDARIKSGIGQLRTIAEVIYDTNNSSYGADTADINVEECFEGTTASCPADVAANVTSLRSDVSTAYASSALHAESTASGFCVEALMKNGKYLCVDSTGATKEGTAAGCSTAADDVTC